MADTQVIVVTGTNRGVGKGIVQLLAKQQLDRPLTIYATSRSGIDSNIEASAPNIVLYRKLDITNPQSIESFFHSALKEHTAIDVLVNNAAVSNDYRETPEFAAETVWTNYGGTRDMCKAFLSQPNLRPGSRIVNITSGYNRLQTYAPDLQEAFRKADAISTLNDLADAYLESAKRGQAAQQQAGWGSGARSYKVSKALINALTIVLAQQHPDVLVNCCCPGWVNTDMGNQAQGTPPKTLEEGARVPTRLAIGDLGPDGDDNGGLGRESARTSGHFFENDNIMQPGWGKAKLWLKL
jgi:carbonyl reductase 1